MGVDSMEKVKCNTPPLENAKEFSEVAGGGVPSEDGGKNGKVKSVYMDLRGFAAEGIVIDPDFFDL